MRTGDDRRRCGCGRVRFQFRGAAPAIPQCGLPARAPASCRAFRSAAAPLLVLVVFAIFIETKNVPDGFDRAQASPHVSALAEALRGLVKEALDQFFGDAGDALLLF